MVFSGLANESARLTYTTRRWIFQRRIRRRALPGGDARGSSRRIIVTGAHYSNLPRSIYLSFTSREDVSCVTMSAARNPPACIIHSFILKLHEGHTVACARKWKRILSLASATARQSRTTWQTALFPPTNLPDVSPVATEKPQRENKRRILSV